MAKEIYPLSYRDRVRARRSRQASQRECCEGSKGRPDEVSQIGDDQVEKGVGESTWIYSGGGYLIRLRHTEVRNF